MIQFEYVIENPSGFHARPASMLVKEAMLYKSSIHFQRGNVRVNCKSIMAILSAGVKNGEQVKFNIEGEDEVDAEKGFKSFLENSFKGV